MEEGNKMGQIDSSIYFQSQGPDVVGNLQRGLALRDMMDERSLRNKELNENEAIKSAYSQGIKQGPDGKQYLDQNATLSAIAKVNPMKAYQQQRAFELDDVQKRKEDIEKKLQSIDLGSRILSGVKDQASFDKAIETGQKFGFDVSGLGKYYDPDLVKQYQSMSMTGKERLENEYRQMDYQFKERNADLDDKKFMSDESYRNRQLLQKEREIQENSKTERQKASPFEQERQKLAARDFQKSQQGVVNVNKNINIVDDAMDSLKQYSNNTLFGTGPMASMYGLKKYVDQDTENLNAKLKAVNLRNMTTMFSGMSKAVDSDAERRAWQGTQADVANDDLTNANILLGQKSILLKDKEEAKAQNQFVRQYGSLDGYKSPIDGRVKTMVSSDGNMVLVPNEKVLDASKQGYYTIDDYAKKALSKTSTDNKSTSPQNNVFRTDQIDWAE